MTININDSILSIITQDERLKDILFELGFKEITKPGMLQSVGRFMTLKAGASLRKVDLNTIKIRLEALGYQVEGV